MKETEDKQLVSLFKSISNRSILKHIQTPKITFSEPSKQLLFEAVFK